MWRPEENLLRTAASYKSDTDHFSGRTIKNSRQLRTPEKKAGNWVEHLSLPVEWCRILKWLEVKQAVLSGENEYAYVLISVFR